MRKLDKILIENGWSTEKPIDYPYTVHAINCISNAGGYDIMLIDDNEFAILRMYVDSRDEYYFTRPLEIVDSTIDPDGFNIDLNNTIAIR